MATESTTTIPNIPQHPFEKAGLGKFPYRFLHTERKVFVVAAGTPEAYTVPGSCCDYCYTAISTEYWLKSSDEKRFKVGCDCICKYDRDPVLQKAVKDEQLRLARLQRGNKAVEKRRRAKEARELEFQRVRDEKRQAYLSTPEKVEFIGRLREFAPQNGFLASLLENFDKWGSLTEAQEAPAQRIIAELDVPPSRYVGSVGERLTLEITVDKVINLNPSDGRGYRRYVGGPRFLYICHDPEHNIIVYRGNSYLLPTKGDTASISFLIKDHVEYEGKLQTEVWRPQPVKNS